MENDFFNDDLDLNLGDDDLGLGSDGGLNLDDDDLLLDLDGLDSGDTGWGDDNDSDYQEEKKPRKKKHGGLIAFLIILVIVAAAAVAAMVLALTGKLSVITNLINGAPAETPAAVTETAAATEAAETETPYETAEATETPVPTETVAPTETPAVETDDGAPDGTESGIVDYTALPDVPLLKYVPAESGTLVYVNAYGDQIAAATNADGSASMQLDKNTATHAQQMIAAAATAGYNLKISQGYRAVEETTYTDVKEHFTGLCIDINDVNTVRGTFVKDAAYAAEVQWLKDNAAAYGFVMTEEADEDGNSMAYHFAYVGTDTAAAVAAAGGYLNSYTG